MRPLAAAALALTLIAGLGAEEAVLAGNSAGPSAPGAAFNAKIGNPALRVDGWPPVNTDYRIRFLRQSNPAFAGEQLLGTFAPGAPVSFRSGVKASVQLIGAPGTIGAAAKLVQPGAKIVVDVSGLDKLAASPAYGKGTPVAECILASDRTWAKWDGLVQVYAGGAQILSAASKAQSYEAFGSIYGFLREAMPAGADRMRFSFTIEDALQADGKYLPLAQCRVVWARLQG